MRAENLEIVTLFSHLFASELEGLVFGIVACSDPHIAYFQYLSCIEIRIFDSLIQEWSANPRITHFKLGGRVSNWNRYGLLGCLSILVLLTFF